MDNKEKHHHHHHRSDFSGEKLMTATILNFGITVVQIIGGLLSNSLSLLSDALHNLGDSTGLLVAFFANKIGEKKADTKKTFGYKRAEILAALFNSSILVATCLILLFEAYQRFVNPEPVDGIIMLIVASFGLLANLISVLMLKKEKDKNLNIKSAYLHLLGDTLSSVAVIAGGIAIWKYNIFWIDPLITTFIGLYIIKHVWHVLKETIEILMQAAPNNINPADIKKKIENLPEVKDLHHVHIWRYTDNLIHFEGHISTKKDEKISNTDILLERIRKILEQEFNINHVTIQFEYNVDDCKELIANI